MRNYAQTILKIAVAIAVLVAAAALFRWAQHSISSKEKEATAHVQIETVQKAMFVVRIAERGDLEALEEVEIKSDVAGVIEELYVENGDSVSKGQKLFTIDDEYITQRLKAAQAEYDVAEGQVEQTRISGELEMRRVEHDIEMARKGVKSAEANLTAVSAMGEQQILQAQSALKKLETDTTKRLQAESGRADLALAQAQLNVKARKDALQLAQSDADRYQKLLERKFVSKSQYESVQKLLNEAQASHENAIENEKLAQLNCDSAKESFQQLAQDVLDQKQNLERLESAVAAQKTEGQLRVDQQQKGLENLLDSVDGQKRNVEIGLESARKYMERSQAELSRLQEELRWTIKLAPRSGTVTDCEIEVGQAVASGRSEWGGGQPLMKIADLSQMVVRTYVNEMEISRVHEGLRAEVRVSAYRERAFDGKVWRIAPTAGLKDNVRTFEVTVLLTHASDLLRPQMTADVDIIVSERDNILQMPIAALIEKDATIVFAWIPEKEIHRFKVGQPLSMKLPNVEELFPSQVTQIPSDTRYIDDRIIYEVRIRVEDNPDAFRWGPPIPMSLRLSDMETLSEIMCIVHKEQEPYVLLMPDELSPGDDASLLETEEIRVVIGERNENSVEVLEGVQEGDRVRVPELSRRDLFMWED